MSRDYLNALQKIALASEDEERQFRRDAQRRIALLAAARTEAYRRYNLLKAMVEAAAAHADCESSAAAQVSRIAALTGWSESDSGWPDFKGALAEVARTIHADLHGSGRDEEPKEVAAAAVTDAFRRFEAWYRGHYGAEFLALMEQQQAFQPAVDF
ncbi:MAG: hypothetical protein HYR63_17115 [Proteobacteria bacterium]|nr:hypothetical protein [Pseudomonadota bacterium]MBI3499954.1 hypothetical protein [Pseudomonadota bacterium]